MPIRGFYLASVIAARRLPFSLGLAQVLALLRAWSKRRQRRRNAYIERVKRIGAARYSLCWAGFWSLGFGILFAYDLTTDNCCSGSVVEIAAFAGVFAIAMGALFFVLTYIIVRADLSLSRRRKP